ncbi:hypothetical protein SELMODRAFT_228207 [Selaginella moellendorffii]|uniref:Uncharacterized protein n=1 Tax=Selaginella moellendorffii TaxID=88036 RepID=D8RRD7_SELML|nr:hypothetical protein SELMODRAFT_228207 [Selaginella moellendorffii]
MSGAQGALPPGSFTDTTYESQEGAKIQERVDSKEDAHGIPVKMGTDEQHKDEAAGHGGPVFGQPDAKKEDDIGVSGTA